MTALTAASLEGRGRPDGEGSNGQPRTTSLMMYFVFPPV